MFNSNLHLVVDITWRLSTAMPALDNDRCCSEYFWDFYDKSMTGKVFRLQHHHTKLRRLLSGWRFCFAEPLSC